MRWRLAVVVAILAGAVAMAAVQRQAPAAGPGSAATEPGSAAAEPGSAAAEPRGGRSDAGAAPAIVPPSQEDLLWAAGQGESLVPAHEIIAGGPPPDGIPPIDAPRFGPAAAVDWLAGDEPVAVVEVGGDVRAYPLQILIWHEIVNDRFGDLPVAVTYCPLCNSVIAFDGTVGGRPNSFGTSGLVWRSDLVMYDRRTHSLWSQMEGRAIQGPLAGTRLRWLPVSHVSWAEFRAAYPDGQVLQRDTGAYRPYGANPYAGYDSTARPFLFIGKPDPRLPALARVLGVARDRQAVAWSFDRLEQERVIHWGDLVVFYSPHAVSAVDAADVAAGRRVGATAVFVRQAGGRDLTFAADGDAVRDVETGSTWDIFGRAVAGPLAGARLTPVPKVDAFWFAWAAFHPNTELDPAGL